jgi:hypothetical protein
MTASTDRYPHVTNLGLLARHRKARQRMRDAVARFEAAIAPYREELERRARAAHPFVLIHRHVVGKRYCISGWWPDEDHVIGVHEIDRPKDAEAGPYLHANLHEFIVTNERLTGR